MSDDDDDIVIRVSRDELKLIRTSLILHRYDYFPLFPTQEKWCSSDFKDMATNTDLLTNKISNIIIEVSGNKERVRS